MLLRICDSCGRKIEQGKKCPCRNTRRKDYDIAYNKQSKGFYHSKQWKALQSYAASRANYCDEYALKYGGIVTPGRIAHHIKPLSESPASALDDNNIIYVSDKTHRYIHSEYDKGGQAKQAMQEKLLGVRLGD